MKAHVQSWTRAVGICLAVASVIQAQQIVLSADNFSKHNVWTHEYWANYNNHNVDCKGWVWVIHNGWSWNQWYGCWTTFTGPSGRYEVRVGLHEKGNSYGECPWRVKVDGTVIGQGTSPGRPSHINQCYVDDCHVYPVVGETNIDNGDELRYESQAVMNPRPGCGGGEYGGWYNLVLIPKGDPTKVATPTIEPSSHSMLGGSVEVTLSVSTDGAQIRYTLDGSAPTTSSTLYDGAFTVTLAVGETVTVTARGFKSGLEASAAAEAAYQRVDPTTIELKRVAVPIVSVTQPTGSGSHDIDIIRDGEYPTSGGFDLAYATYDGSNHDKDFYGYEFDGELTFTRLRYYVGRINEDRGGTFETVGIEVRKDGAWADVTGLTSTPPYDNQTIPEFSSTEFTFDPATGDAIRMYGRPTQAQYIWVGCAELDVYAGDAVAACAPVPADRTPVARGAAGAGRVEAYTILGRRAPLPACSAATGIRSASGVRVLRRPAGGRTTVVFRTGTELN